MKLCSGMHALTLSSMSSLQDSSAPCQEHFPQQLHKEPSMDEILVLTNDKYTNILILVSMLF